MGGMNHQPCNKPGTSYLRFSTMMSRWLSVAYSEVEQANVALEDVLLAELDGNGVGGTVTQVSKLLDDSRFELTQLLGVVRMLREDMQKHDFNDLPTLQSTDLELLGTQLITAGMVQSASWSIVYKMMRRDGFHGVLDYFEQEIGGLRQQTKALIDAVNGTEEMAKVGQLNFVLEENRLGNFKVEFATLYSSWHWFQQVFLASSMLSTELWYRHCGVGSLLNQRESTQVA